MILALAVAFLVVWLLGVALSVTFGGLIHLLLVLAVVTLAYHFILEDDRETGHYSIFEQ